MTVTTDSIPDVLARAIRNGAQNLHITPDRNIRVRVGGLIANIGSTDDAAFEAFINSIMDDRGRAEMTKTGSTTAMATIAGTIQRVLIYRSAGKPIAAIRFHRDNVPSPAELGIPDDIVRLTDAASGWLLISGPQGVGKTTTIASLTKHMAANAALPRHIVTIERPVEMRINSDDGLVTHIEVPHDAPTIPAAMRTVLRADCQAAVIGELRMENDVASAWVDLVDAGLLVLGNTHGPDPVRAISRVLDALPAAERERGRRVIAHGMVASIGQRLVRDRDDKLVLITSVLHGSPAVTNAILDENFADLNTMLESTPNRTFQMALAPLVPSRISPEAADRMLRADNLART